ncbi:DarT ssDNA thymidine ADP-ribosyltransferase family protein [Ruegeria sp. HKCCSP351]|uniref:DarT ssDNA thymidine ADP-ribosyltransferase family protein n=1 Tax=Ruegeria sp. HKCCSP351 TaxID=2794832 RepID=UPI001AE7B8FF|nr:DarT ssDNA thymidine ADP-ribosyltransferase family protein [Ruegeria sp. HKCCSP351]
MGISSARYHAHLEEWLGRFSNYKKKWPKHLFHHANIGAAIDILKSGQLLSRDDAIAGEVLRQDIAPADIVQNRDVAHQFARLYFRPRTPTQFHIEGIRKPADYYMGRHGGLLVMLAFSSEKILTMEGTRFSTCNMQSPLSQVFDGDDGFEQLDFEGIFHDEANPSDDQKKKRCAEVLAQSPLDVATALSAIIVRTDADVATMKFLLTREGLHHFVPKIRKSQGTGVFFHKHTAVQYVDSAPGRINFKLMESRSSGDIHTQMSIFDDANACFYQMVDANLKAHQGYYTEHNLPAGNYRVVFHLENCFAHESQVNLTR